MFALVISWIWCSPLAIYTFATECWIPEPPRNCVVGNPVFLQLYDEDSPKCTVQKEGVLRQEEDEAVSER